MIRFVVILVLSLALAGCVTRSQEIADGTLPRGSGIASFEGLPGKTMRAFYHRPANHRGDSPVLIVMHGVKRNADWYRDAWRGLSERHGIFVVAPEFTRSDFPGGRAYSRGNMRTGNGAPAPLATWSFNAVEKLFDDVRRWSGSTRDRYLLFGHSAGAQFVHRMITFMPDLRVARAVAANAGWYTMPDDGEAFPYGLGASGVSEAQLRAAFSHNLTVMLGDADTDPDHKYLHRKPSAMRQGVHRFARGLAYFEAAKAKAARIGAAFAWRREIVPGAGHSTHEMKDAALRVLLADR
jgi:poly(3-hydroxybutyrate) depolymerase